MESDPQTPEPRVIYSASVGSILGVSGCSAQGVDHAWETQARDGREVRVCAHCGDEKWSFGPDEDAELARRFPQFAGPGHPTQ
jgi:hypothetical protein